MSNAAFKGISHDYKQNFRLFKKFYGGAFNYRCVKKAYKTFIVSSLLSPIVLKKQLSTKHTKCTNKNRVIAKYMRLSFR